MAARRRDAGRRSYQDFDPSSEWLRGEGSDTLVFQLPGFKKEEVKLQLDSSRNLRITGERKLEENKWSRFTTNVKVPADYDVNGLLSNFERNGVLKIIMPKIITHSQPQPKTTPRKPQVQPSLTQKPEVQPSSTQKPRVQPSSTQKPQVQSSSTQKPQMQPSPTQKPEVQPSPIQKPQVQSSTTQKPQVQPPPTQKPQVQPPLTQKPVTQPETGVQPKPTTQFDQQMIGKVSEPKVSQKIPEKEKEKEKEQQQVNANAEAKKFTGEESERYESAGESANDDSERVKDGSITGVAAAGMGMTVPKQWIVNVIVDILVVLALLMYMIYSQRSSTRATDD
ncbi:inactive protein RESTRICTED TEV MOVEMENT 2-like [Macadamia integrifolia]|uniref:inactive protein RESTRICTED TEV MOVEMENT 2-like n=1 Tax=Macadamia integrifolia TaxID=60698 RepID=UPI001C4F5B4D|nr:inactive protein RESTRICTED TEV MOVEMENT 2-like [Macadamia integrifolia]